MTGDDVIKLRNILFGVFRHALTTYGGYLVADGWLSKDDLSTGIGAILAIAGILFSVGEKAIMLHRQGNAKLAMQRAVTAAKSAAPILALVACLGIASCATPTTPNADAEKALIASCNAYQVTLHALGDLKATGQLSATNISDIDNANKAVGTFCDPTKPPPADLVSAGATVAAEAATLTTILATKKGIQ